MSKYDATTVVFDCVWLVPNKLGAILAPPLLNLSRDFFPVEIFAEPSGDQCRYTVKNLDRHLQLWFEAPAQTTCIQIINRIGRISLPIQYDPEPFRNRRVLFTTNKNNRPEWIADWIRYHRDVHGANAVLIYDNESTDYTPDELVEYLARLSGVDSIVVTSWPFKFGPSGFRGRSHWDSDYGRLGALEDARWRFLSEARSVLNLDVDELVLPLRSSIFELTETSPTRCIRFHGRWTVRTDELPPTLVHRSFHETFVLRSSIARRVRPLPDDLCATKWATVPAASRPGQQWKFHSIAGIHRRPEPVRLVSFRHFREITTNWKYARSVPFAKCMVELDDDLVAAYRLVDWTS